MEILHYIGLYLLALMGALLLGAVSAIFVVGTHWLIMKALRREPGISSRFSSWRPSQVCCSLASVTCRTAAG